jgi:galactokinase
MLLTASHDSCQYVYNCTRTETDMLHDLCIANGALGSRQTGTSVVVASWYGNVIDE